jgi:hypothetical protein
MSATRWASAALPALLLAGLVGAAGRKDRSAAVNVCALGILSPSGKVLFLPSAGSGVEAVALFNGKALWEAKDASKLLLATDDRVFAWTTVKGKRNQLKVVVLDAITGERLRVSEAIALPGWASVTKDYGQRFRSTARLEKGALVLLWKAQTFYDGGVPLPAGEPDPHARSASGAVRVDLRTGKATPVKGARPKDADFPEEEPSGAGTARLAGWVFSVEEKDPEVGFPHSLTRRTLKARTADGKRSWQRPIAGDVYLPPRP